MEQKTNGFDGLPGKVAMLQDQLDRMEKKINKLPGILEESEDKYLSIDEAAEFIKLAKQTIYGLVCKRRIPFIKKKGTKKLRFSKRDLTSWILSGRRNVGSNY